MGPTVSPTVGVSVIPAAYTSLRKADNGAKPSVSPNIGPSVSPTVGPSIGPTVGPSESLIYHSGDYPY